MRISKAKSVSSEIKVNNASLNNNNNNNNTSGYLSDSGDSIPSLPFPTRASSVKPILQLIGNFGKDHGCYLLLKAADNNGFEKSLHHRAKVEWFNEMMTTFFEKDFGIFHMYKKHNAMTLTKKILRK